MHRHVRALTLPLALCLPLVGACSSSTNERKVQAPAAQPSTVQNRIDAMTTAADTNAVSSIVTAPTTTSARLVKDGKVTGWILRDGEKPTKFKIADYKPVATLSVDKLNIESSQALSAKVCNGPARVTTAVVATGKAVTAIQCGEDKRAKIVLVGGKELAEPAKDRFSADGIRKAVEAASTVVSKEAPLALNLNQADAVSLIMTSMKSGHHTCQYPGVSLPMKGKELTRLAPSPCITKVDEKVEKYYKDRGALDLKAIDAEKTSKILFEAASSVKADLGKCSTVQLRSTKKGELQALLGCEVDGKKVSAVKKIA